MRAIIHHSSNFNYNFILERVVGQNMSTGKRKNSGNTFKAEDIYERERNSYNIFVFIPPNPE